MVLFVQSVRNTLSCLVLCNSHRLQNLLLRLLLLYFFRIEGRRFCLVGVPSANAQLNKEQILY